MKRQGVFDLVTLGLLWGLGFLLIRMAVPEFGAVVLIEVRTLLAAAILLPLVAARRHAGAVLAHWRPILAVGLVHYALPFCLFAWAMLSLPAGYSSIINATSPLFAAIVARIWIGERLTTSRAAGLVLGSAGMFLLVRDQLSASGAASALAIAAAAGGAFCYGFAAVFAKRALAGVSPLAVAGGSMAAAALVLLPASLWLWPAQAPSPQAWGVTAVLGVLCTAIAFVLYFRLISSAGPTRAISVTFLVPVFALLFGAVFAGEVITAPMIIGGVIIAIGTALAAGLLDFRYLLRRSAAFAARVALVAALPFAWDDIPTDLHAAELSTPFYVSANTFSSRPNSDWDTFATLAATGELEFVSTNRDRVMSLFAEYHFSDDKRVDGTTFAGISAGYQLSRWDARAYWFAARFPGSASEPGFKLRVRHRLRDGHKLGVEYLADTAKPRGGELKLGYYGSLRPNLSMKLLFGADLGRSGTPLAHLEISWQAR
jgi:drug/metabolite transporter (DMT)-like permease